MVRSTNVHFKRGFLIPFLDLRALMTLRTQITVHINKLSMLWAYAFFTTLFLSTCIPQRSFFSTSIYFY